MHGGPASKQDRRYHSRLFYQENHFINAWRRCVKLGSPLHGPRTRSIPATATLSELRKQHRELLETASPFLLTLQEAVEAEPSYAVLLVDTRARILDLRADQWTTTCGAQVNLFPGASVGEKDIGNNGPGTALVTGRAISFSGFEHYNQSLLGWQTMGVPIITPGGRQVGALGVFLSRYSRACKNLMNHLMLQAKMLGYVFRSAADQAPPGPRPVNAGPRSEQLRIAMRIMGGFAHEVRNPLAVIRGFAQLLLEGKAADRTDHYLSLIVDEVDRIKERIRGFISLSSCENVDYRELDIRTLLRDVEMLLQSYVLLNGVRLKVETEPGTGVVWGNAEQLRQAILNLVYNALESTFTDDTVTLRAAAVGGRVRITVTDNGAGIAEQVMPRIFEPFFSTRDGVGLGLAVSQDIVHRHAGTLTVESTPGEGTTAVIDLPAAEIPGI